MDIKSIQSAGEFIETARAHGYSVPVQMCYGIQQCMEKHNFTFMQAYAYLVTKGRIHLAGDYFIYALSED